jgi:UDP-N-acetylglucosamine diphosphorylase/glucosamine-1-phosphate N-acetyltransferase
MERPLIVFEDERVDRLSPLALTRPVFDLICGIFPLAEKLKLGLAAARAGKEPDIYFHTRRYLASALGGRAGRRVDSFSGLAAGKGAGEGLVSLVNGRLLWDDSLPEAIDPAWVGKYLCDGSVVWANAPASWIGRLDGMSGTTLGGDICEDLPAKELNARLIGYPWDPVLLNGEEIERDFARLGGAAIEADIPAGVHLVNQDAIRLARDVNLSPGVVIDASRGPVSIAEGVTVMANASLAGPLSIGAGSTIKMGAKIYGETTIGPVCKVGGEVGESIIHGYSNKQHDGFVGHSYLGEWVNIGAGTDTSDMKNNYSTVRLTVAGESVDSGHPFVGLFMGDHSKCGIGTTFNTGTIMGACCNIFGAGFPPKYIPSFSWGGSTGFNEHTLERAIVTARTAMARRDKTLDNEGESILREVYELTREERLSFFGI